MRLLRKLSLALLVALAATGLTMRNGYGWGACHTSSTSVGSGGVSHSGSTTVDGRYGDYSTSHGSSWGADGSSHYGSASGPYGSYSHSSSTSYGADGAYHSGYTSTPYGSYSHAGYTGYGAEGAYHTGYTSSPYGTAYHAGYAGYGGAYAGGVAVPGVAAPVAVPAVTSSYTMATGVPAMPIVAGYAGGGFHAAVVGVPVVRPFAAGVYRRPVW